MSKPSRKLIAAFAQLDALYAELPTVTCRGRCALACGPIPLFDLEAHRLRLTAHAAPRTVGDDRCVYLVRDRCTAYAVRPLICRVWGVVRMLSCMHGCVPDRWLRDDEFLRLAQRIERLGGGRVLQTGPGGLTDRRESFAALGAPRQSPEAIERHAERVRGLRAVHGGRILAAVDARDDPD